MNNSEADKNDGKVFETQRTPKVRKRCPVQGIEKRPLTSTGWSQENRPHHEGLCKFCEKLGLNQLNQKLQCVKCYFYERGLLDTFE